MLREESEEALEADHTDRRHRGFCTQLAVAFGEHRLHTRRLYSKLCWQIVLVRCRWCCSKQRGACARVTTKSRVIEATEGAPRWPVDIFGSDRWRQSMGAA